MSKREITKGQVQDKVSMKPFTSWHIGGEADRLYWPLDLQDLQQFLKRLPQTESLTWIGLGSNILVSDSGIEGTTIITQGVLKEMALTSATQIRAEAGLSCAQVARFAAKNNLVGGEFLAGIPGTVGGALLMNAGAFGGETWEKVSQIETIDRTGKITLHSASDFKFAYRQITGLKNDEWFVSAIFDFTPGDGKESLSKIKTLLERRAQTQPTGEPSCGSVFRNPPENYAARLIENAGLKGHTIGAAQVSLKHANFIINTGDATAADTFALVQFVQKTVLEKTGIALHPEFKWVGRP
ncbi:MAG: UDP-N-acetylmuramate dehydrogenase [Gammaproteobacteria bacterium]|nr:UDP-N-acetylmuramate dehydrogenase [Gammaproteobacteria bacterium]